MGGLVGGWVEILEILHLCRPSPGARGSAIKQAARMQPPSQAAQLLNRTAVHLPVPQLPAPCVPATLAEAWAECTEKVNQLAPLYMWQETTAPGDIWLYINSTMLPTYCKGEICVVPTLHLDSRLLPVCLATYLFQSS